MRDGDDATDDADRAREREDTLLDAHPGGVLLTAWSLVG